MSGAAYGLPKPDEALDIKTIRKLGNTKISPNGILFTVFCECHILTRFFLVLLGKSYAQNFSDFRVHTKSDLLQWELVKNGISELHSL